jgi:hypothetical protein
MKTIISTMTAAILAAGALAAPANAATYETDLGFAGADAEGLFSRFNGDVDAEAPAKCSKDRKIQLFHKDDGPDTKVGSTRSDSSAFWSLMLETDSLVEGIYYAKTPTAKFSNGLVCKGDKSNEILFA